MRALKLSLSLCAVLLALSWGVARAEEAKPAAPAQAKAEAGDPASHLPADSVTQHLIALGGRQLTYKATAGTLPLFNAKGDIAAKIFYVSYVVEGVPGRPVTFAFNGGPGASAAFLHMGALGPRAVPFSETGAEPIRPVQLADNADSWLAFTDLVFVDPVGTGYSRTATGGEEAEHAYWGVEKDADSIEEFVNLYLARAGRELSPVIWRERAMADFAQHCSQTGFWRRVWYERRTHGFPRVRVFHAAGRTVRCPAADIRAALARSRAYRNARTPRRRSRPFARRRFSPGRIISFTSSKA